ncbi:hypothetical protein QYE76_055139 [Lolium multiflorum]|uniref:Dynein light chain n=2 Tax=Lolium TaxID=4520 RepID=A0AAD8T009_LOLMU|nr:hypothetical protein QYE76_055139 [Lolium multiflorum]
MSVKSCAYPASAYKRAGVRPDLLASSLLPHQFTPIIESSRSTGKRGAKMLEGKATVEDTDMPAKMQLQATSAASRALDRFDVLDCRSIAAHIKKEFDTIHGPGWQCVVGCSFGCYFTHSKGSFIYFKLESLRFLVFKGAADEQPRPC